MSRTALATIWPPTATVAAEAGHRRMSPMQAIRQKCLDCSGHHLAEVKLCEAVGCSLWPFRAGRHPYTRKGLLEANSGQRRSPGSPIPVSRPFSGIDLQQEDFGRDGDFSGPASPLPSPHGAI